MKDVSDTDLQGHWSVIFFYPADFTFVCPTELEDLSDHYDQFRKLNCEIYSVSTDSAYVHKAWADASKSIAKIRYPMLSDSATWLSRFFGVYIEETGQALRGTSSSTPGEIKPMRCMTWASAAMPTNWCASWKPRNSSPSTATQVCPAKWKPGAATLKPGLDLVGKL